MSDPLCASDRCRAVADGRPRAAITLRRRIVACLLTILGVPLVAMLALEVVFAVFMPVTDVPSLYWDPTIGIPLRNPDQSGRLVHGDFIDARYHFNAQGWNSPRDYTLFKPPGTRRVCLVGDSMVEAYHVQPEQSLCVLAEKQMSRADRPVEWYAFGRAGFGTVAEYLVIRHHALAYEPDVVVLLFVALNDLTDTSPYLSRPAANQSTMVLGEDGELVLIPPTSPWKPSLVLNLARKSALFRYFYVQKKMFMRTPPPFSEKARRFLDTEAESSDMVGASHGPLSAEERQQKTWDLVEAILRKARSDCAERGAVFALAYYGSRPEIHAALENTVHVPPPKEVDPYCIAERLDEMGREFLEPMANRLQIPYLDLTAAMVDGVRETGQRHDFPDDVHYSPAGHAFAAKAIAAWVEDILAGRQHH